MSQAKTRSLSAQSVGLRPTQNIFVLLNSVGLYEIKGCNPTAALFVRKAVRYDAKGRLRIDPHSLAYKSGAQFHLRTASQSA